MQVQLNTRVEQEVLQALHAEREKTGRSLASLVEEALRAYYNLPTMEKPGEE